MIREKLRYKFVGTLGFITPYGQMGRCGRFYRKRMGGEVLVSVFWH